MKPHICKSGFSQDLGYLCYIRDMEEPSPNASYEELQTWSAYGLGATPKEAFKNWELNIGKVTKED